LASAQPPKTMALRPTTTSECPLLDPERSGATNRSERQGTIGGSVWTHQSGQDKRTARNSRSRTRWRISREGAGQKEVDKDGRTTAGTQATRETNAPGARLHVVFRPRHLLPLAAALLLPRCPTHEARSSEPARAHIGAAQGTGRVRAMSEWGTHANHRDGGLRRAPGASLLPPPGSPPGSAALGPDQRASPILKIVPQIYCSTTND
jgi:hypothetical protein